MMTTNEIALQIPTVRSARDMYMRMLRVMDVIKQCKIISNVELRKKINCDLTTILDALESCGKIRHELRKEETFIAERFGHHGPLDQEGFEIVGNDKDTIVVLFEGKEVEIPNPFKYRRKLEYGEYKEKVQVVRKYWTWVE